MNAEKRENNDESASSDLEGSSGGNEAATIPKKRGRPAKAVEKVPSGRGRGRPAKAGKPKVAAPISATGKGRGRPKAAAKRSAEEDDDDADADYEERSPKKVAKSVGKRTPGRPRKAAPPSDDDDDDDDYQDTADDADDEPQAAVGRPVSGVVNLNIQRTGRGQGRPKKAVTEAAKKSTDVSPKKRGRPPANKANAQRGRPKARASSEDNDDSKDGEDSNDSLKADESVESVDDNDDGEFITSDKNPRDSLPANQLAAA